MSDQKINCLIVDDEPIGREIIENFVIRTSNLALIASCTDAFAAMDVLREGTVDLLISDIEMPKISGLELVKSLPHPPVIIFVTAFENFAVDGFELDVADYLLKPVSYERFLKAINKVSIQLEALRRHENFKLSSASFIFVKAQNKLNKIPFENILYIESIKDYIKIHTASDIYVVYSTLKSMEEKLPSNMFCRVHQSYIVSLYHIQSLMGNVIELVGGTTIPVSKSNKTALYKLLNIGDVN